MQRWITKCNTNTQYPHGQIMPIQIEINLWAPTSQFHLILGKNSWRQSKNSDLSMAMPINSILAECDFIFVPMFYFEPDCCRFFLLCIYMFWSLFFVPRDFFYFMLIIECVSFFIWSLMNRATAKMQQTRKKEILKQHITAAAAIFTVDLFLMEWEVKMWE